MSEPEYNRACGLITDAIAALALSCLLGFPVYANELTNTERTAAANIAKGAQWRQAITKSATVSSTSVSTHPLGIQTLSIEADWKKQNTGARLARLYQHDHRSVQSRLLIINLDTQQVVEERSIGSVHLPLSAQEIDYATQLLHNNTEMLNRVNQHRLLYALAPLDNLRGFDVKASIYEPLYPDHLCSNQRCVLFALVDNTLTVSTVEPLVLLSSGNVTLLQSTLRD